MDKHDRPYKCPADGCEKLPGFTYSGGLLRHEREVHGKHGGPKNPLNCPHVNCKRHSGKGFSRLENLNEHLRRVHTSTPGLAGTVSDDREDSVSVVGSEKLGDKRKPDDDLRDENKRLRMEVQNFQSRVHVLEVAKQALEHQIEGHNRQQRAMMEQIRQLRESQPQPQISPYDTNRLGSASAAPMLDDDTGVSSLLS